MTETPNSSCAADGILAPPPESKNHLVDQLIKNTATVFFIVFLGLPLCFHLVSNFQNSPIHEGKLPITAVTTYGKYVLHTVHQLEGSLTPSNYRALRPIFAYLETAAVSTATQLGIFDALANVHDNEIERKMINVGELTRSVLTHHPKFRNLLKPDSTKFQTQYEVTKPGIDRLCQYLVSIGLLQVNYDHLHNHEERYSLTSVSEWYVTNKPGSLSGVALNFGSDQFLPFVYLNESVLFGTSAYQQYHGEAQFHRHKSNPVVGHLFARTMIGLGALGENEGVSNLFDWTPFSTIFDIAGASGNLGQRILFDHLHLNAVIFDLPEVIARTAPMWKNLDVKRVTFQSGDFFVAETIPTLISDERSSKGAGVYLLKQIIHDWADEPAMKILKNIRSRMTTDCRLIIVDRVLVRGESQVMGMGRQDADLMMLMTFGAGARERTSKEFINLLTLSGFHVVEIRQLQSAFSMIVAAPAHS
jgi:hypothetical protein